MLFEVIISFKHYFGIVRFPSEEVMEYRIKHNGPWYNSFDPNDKENTLLLKLMSK